MTPEKENELYKKYPKIFGEKDLPASKTCMCWGISVGDGWYDLIDHLCSSLQFHTDKNNYAQVVAVQVKEKFGGLRFYTHGTDDYLRGYISFAESLSYKICEDCGTNQNVTQTKGWVKTVCKECLEKREKERG